MPGLEPGNQQPAGSAAGVEHRLRVLGVPPEVLDLRAVGVEVRPPLGDEPVVPCLRRLHALPCDDLSDGRAGLHDRHDRRARAAGRLVADPSRARHRGVRGQRLDGPRCRRRRDPRARRGALGARGAVRRRRRPATFTVDGEELDAPAGTVVFVRDPAANRARGRRRAGHDRARDRRPARRAVPPTRVGAERGRPRPVRPGPLRGGEGSGSSRRSTRHEDDGGLLYNLACAEAQLGETDAALEHLATAVAERPDLREPARDDADLAPIRDDPRFPGLAVEPHQPVREAVLLDVAHVAEARLLERAPRAAVRLLDRGDACRPPARAKTTSRANSARMRGPSPRPISSASPIRRSTPATPSPTWTTSSHSG